MYKNNQNDDFLTVQEVAEILKITDLTIYKYIKEGEIEAIDLGGHYRIRRTSLYTFIDARKVGNHK